MPVQLEMSLAICSAVTSSLDLLLLQPVALGLVIFLFQLQPFRLELGGLLVVLPLRGGFFLVGQVLDALFQ